jgi:hypothetical protein
MNNNRNQFLEGLIRGAAEKAKSQEEFDNELKKLFPNSKITTIDMSKVGFGSNKSDDEQEQASSEEYKNHSGNDCECSGCLLNETLRKTEGEAKKKDSTYYAALGFIKDKCGNDLNESLGYYGHLTGLKKEAFKRLQRAVTDYGYACISLNALQEIIEGSKKTDDK